MNVQKKLTKLQAYNVMLHFLEELYEKEKSYYLGDILSNSEFWSDGITADRGAWSDWQKAIQVTALQDKSLRKYNSLTPVQASKAMFNYVDHYVSFYDPKPEYLINLLRLLQLLCNKKNESMWLLWLEIVKKVMQMSDPRYYLEFDNS